MPDPLPLTDPYLTGLPVHERGEALVDVREVGPLLVDDRMAPVHDSYALLRVTVVDRLVLAQSLLPRGLRLLVIEGYRPESVQDAHFRSYVDDLRAEHPDWSDERAAAEAAWYCAPADAAPHLTGGAADLTLCTVGGIELPMGGPVHAVTAAVLADVAGEASVGHGTVGHGTVGDPLFAQARANRATLAQALSAAGLVNLPTAWWHWSYGDRYWCHRTGSSRAIYGPVGLTR
jgi:D-alanyl-D-alanine dipeptidase